MPVLAAVLAAGGGTRFEGSTHKLLVPFRGKPLVRWALDAAVGSGIAEVVVVTGAVDLSHVVPAGVRTLQNDEWQEGIATSLALAVDEAMRLGHEGVVVALGDQPLITSDAWRAVANAHGEIVVATYEGRRGHPVKIGSLAMWEIPRRGDRGAGEVMRRKPGYVREVACPGDPADVDRVEDLEQWS